MPFACVLRDRKALSTPKVGRCQIGLGCDGISARSERTSEPSLLINALALMIAGAVTLRLAGMCLAQRWHVAGLRALMLWTSVPGTSANVRARQNLP